MIDWAKIIAGVLKVLSSLASWLEGKKHERLGQLEAEKKGDENAKDIVDTLDRIDAGRLPKPPD